MALILILKESQRVLQIKSSVGTESLLSQKFIKKKTPGPQEVATVNFVFIGWESSLELVL